MIDSNVYNELMSDCGTMVISPDIDMKRWAVQQTVTVLANADYYYTKTQIDRLIEEVTASGVTKAEVEEMIQRAVSGKAEQSDVEALSAQVASNTSQLLNTYTKPEVNSLLQSYYDKLQVNAMFNNYAKIDNKTLILNENII
jgi:hypothetical protein